MDAQLKLEEAFPTPVGMNRHKHNNLNFCCCVPHTRGDEPENTEVINIQPIAFPTPVGMNRTGQLNAIAAKSVPHTRGDEP